MTLKTINVFLYLVTGIVNLLSFSTGISIVWVVPVIQRIAESKEPDDPFGRHLTALEESWIAGLLPLGAILGPLLAGRVAGKIGRKRTLLFTAWFNISALVITTFSGSILWFYHARFLAGIALGSAYTVIPMYFAEISENHNRGTIGCTMGIFVALGANFALIVGPYVSVQTYSLICLCPLILFVPGFIVLCPETPVYLATGKEHKELASSLLKLRNKSSDAVHLEIIALLESLQRNSSNGTITKLLKNRALRKGFIISLLVVMLPQASGIGPILSFMPAIFGAAKVELAPEICVIIVGTFQVAATVASSAAVDRTGRRMLLISSSLCAGLTLFSLGMYFFLDTSDFDVSAVSWLPIVSLVVFILAFNIGLGPVPWVVMSELFPPNYTSIAATVSTCACFITSFVLTFSYPTLSLAVGMANVFYIFSAVCLCGGGLIWYLLPETKGKSLQEIQTVLENQKEENEQRSIF